MSNVTWVLLLLSIISPYHVSSFTWDRLFTNQVLDINYWLCQVRWFLVKIPKFNIGFNNHVLATFASPNHRRGQLGRVDWETGCGIVMRGLKDLGWLCGLGEALGVTFVATGDSTSVKLPGLCSDIGVGWHWSHRESASGNEGPLKIHLDEKAYKNTCNIV